MKTKLPLLIALLLVMTAFSSHAQTTKAGLQQGTKTVTTAGTPVKLVSSSTLVDSVEIYARKNDTTANTGVILLGFSPTGGANHRVIAVDGAFVITAVGLKRIDLASIYVDAATNGDGVVWTVQR